MSAPPKEKTIEDWVQTIADATATRPPGMVELMHYGFYLRYKPFGGQCESEESWYALNTLVADGSTVDIQVIKPLFERHSWTAGHLQLEALAQRLWDTISRHARGQYLAGLSIRWNSEDSLEWVLGRLSDCDFDDRAAAEVAVNAIAANQLALLKTLLERSDLPMGRIARFTDHREQQGFQNQISALSERFQDVLLEAAVRCHRIDAAKLMLERGANPNIPCWRLERSYNEWFSALSFSIHEICNRGDSDEVLTQMLLDAGADPQGLPCEGLNKPLFLAMAGDRWALADKLLALGARFSGGDGEVQHVNAGGETVVLSPRQPFFAVFAKDRKWITTAIQPLLEMPELPHGPFYYRGNGQGGQCSTFLDCLLSDADVPNLKKYEKLGLPVELSVPEFHHAVSSGCYNALLYLLRNHPQLPRVMFRIRRHNPDFGASCRQMMLGQPDRSGTNVIEDFKSHGQEPLVLPDGSRVYVHLDCVAPPNHQHGPVTNGCFWVETVTARHRRRHDHIEIGKVRRIWRMAALPVYDVHILELMPLVKEKDGTFFWLGIVMNSLPYGQKVPETFKKALSNWSRGSAWQQMRAAFIEKVRDQNETNPRMPQPVLSNDELAGYPREFWPYLRRLDNGHVGMTEESCSINPDILDIYQVWERQNKPDFHRAADPRCIAWPLWKRIPVEHRPYWIWDDLFGKPTLMTHGANDYQKAMIHKAVTWNNAQFMEALKELESNKATREGTKAE